MDIPLVLDDVVIRKSSAMRRSVRDGFAVGVARVTEAGAPVRDGRLRLLHLAACRSFLFLRSLALGRWGGYAAIALLRVPVLNGVQLRGRFADFGETSRQILLLTRHPHGQLTLTLVVHCCTEANKNHVAKSKRKSNQSYE